MQVDEEIRGIAASSVALPLSVPPGEPAGILPAREGAFWILVALAVPKLFGAVLGIVLRRFLGPGPSGMFDLAYAPYRFLDNFRNFGTGPALVFEETVNRDVANTAWTMNMAAAILVTIVAQILAGPIAHYYRHAEIEPIFRVLSIGYVVASVTSVHYFLLLRDMNFRTRAIPAIGQVIMAGCLAVLFAVWGFGVGVLVVRELVSVGAGAILLWTIYPYRPRVRFVPQIARTLFRYGAWVGIGLTVLYVSQNMDVLIGGRIIGNAEDIGFYTTSWSLAFIAASIFTVVAGSMVFPTLSRLRDDPDSMRETLLKSLRQLGLVMFPTAVFLAAAAPVIIVPLLGTKWAPYQDSFIVLSLLAVYAGTRTMLYVFFEGYKSIGKPWIVPAYNLVKLAVLGPAMVVGAFHGIVGLALAYIPVEAVEIPAALFLAQRVLRISPRAVCRAASTPLMTTLLMAGAVIGTERVFLGALHAGDTRTLLACALVACLVYPGAAFLLDRRTLMETRQVLLRGLR